MLNKCRNDEPKDGYDSRKVESVMECFVRGVGSYPPAASIPFYRLQLIGLIYFFGE